MQALEVDAYRAVRANRITCCWQTTNNFAWCHLQRCKYPLEQQDFKEVPDG